MSEQGSKWRIICFFICALLFYPLSLIRLFIGRLPYWGELYVFTPGVLALAVIVLLLSDFKKSPLFSHFLSPGFLLFYLLFLEWLPSCSFLPFILIISIIYGLPSIGLLFLYFVRLITKKLRNFYLILWH